MTDEAAVLLRELIEAERRAREAPSDYRTGFTDGLRVAYAKVMHRDVAYVIGWVDSYLSYETEFRGYTLEEEDPPGPMYTNESPNIPAYGTGE